MTGVHRRDVKEFRDPGPQCRRDAAGQGVYPFVCRRTLVVRSQLCPGRWRAETCAAQRGTLPSFEALVQSVSRDVRPRTVLDELLRQDIVRTDGDAVVLDLDALVGPADTDQRMHFFAHNVGDHMAAAVENLLAEKPVLLERAVFYNHLTEDSVRDIERHVRRLSQDALLQVNKARRRAPK